MEKKRTKNSTVSRRRLESSGMLKNKGKIKKKDYKKNLNSLEEKAGVIGHAHQLRYFCLYKFVTKVSALVFLLVLYRKYKDLVSLLHKDTVSSLYSS
jgi:hypothetical protein